MGFAYIKLSLQQNAPAQESEPDPNGVDSPHQPPHTEALVGTNRNSTSAALATRPTSPENCSAQSQGAGAVQETMAVAHSSVHPSGPPSGSLSPSSCRQKLASLLSLPKPRNPAATSDVNMVYPLLPIVPDTELHSPCKRSLKVFGRLVPQTPVGYYVAPPPPLRKPKLTGPLFPSTKHPILHSGPQKTAVPQFHKNSSSTPGLCFNVNFSHG